MLLASSLPKTDLLHCNYCHTGQSRTFCNASLYLRCVLHILIVKVNESTLPVLHLTLPIDFKNVSSSHTPSIIYEFKAKLDTYRTASLCSLHLTYTTCAMFLLRDPSHLYYRILLFFPSNLWRPSRPSINTEPRAEMLLHSHTTHLSTQYLSNV